ncbi:hypothetical protein Q8F55_002165 [Vanrija albida]|uniref:Signal recognition particle receptor subunit beta n=1 Tax=Vanrija albida TaxID=181172 RepID=A0ABR3Q923_9TREE
MSSPDEKLQAATSAAADPIAKIVDKLRELPLFNEVVDHPVFKHRLFQHPILQDPRLVATLGGLFILFLIFALYPVGGSTQTSKRKGTPTVLLVGPPDSGKTAIFAKLSQDERPFTHTSLVPSISTIDIPGSGGRSKQARIVDLAGHARLREEVSKHINDADAAVFVVDIVALVRNAAAVAEELPALLSALAGASNRRGLSSEPARLLILAHKTDLLAKSSTTASPPDLTSQARTTALERVRSILTREMDRLKASRGSGGVGGRIEGMGRVASGGKSFWARLFGSAAAEEPDAGNEDDEALVWGSAGAFRWEDVEGVEVSFGTSGVGAAKAVGAGSVADAGNGLDELNDFLWDL